MLEGLAMKKLRLIEEELRVESFPTVQVEEDGGTVRAYGGTLLPPSCPAPACQTYDDTVCGISQGC
jgi:hypothetical protein